MVSKERLTLNKYQALAKSYAEIEGGESVHLVLAKLAVKIENMISGLAKVEEGKATINMDALEEEFGKLLWLLSSLISFYKFKLNDVAAINLAKLKAIKQKVENGQG